MTRFQSGQSGNPSGRPKGARDRTPRIVSRRPDRDMRANLGAHAVQGGPGRPRGSRTGFGKLASLLEYVPGLLENHR